MPERSSRTKFKSENASSSSDAEAGRAERDRVVDLAAHFGDVIVDPFQLVRDFVSRNPEGVLPERDVDVVLRYFGLNGHPVSTLEQIGTTHGITRERVRQIRERVMLGIRGVLSGEGRIGRRTFRVAGAAPIRVKELCSPLEQGRFLPTAWVEAAARHPADPRGATVERAWIEFTLSSLGLRRIHVEGAAGIPAQDLWYRQGCAAPVRITKLAIELRNGLLELVEWSELTPFVDQLADAGMPALPGWNPADVLVALVPLETRADGAVRVRLPHLRTPGLQARRILLDEEKPRPAEWLHDRINEARDEAGVALLDPSVTVLRGSMLRTPGLTPISRSGWWKCDEWIDVSGLSFADLMVQILQEAGGELPVGTLVERILLARPWTPESSILNYLSSKRDRFHRLGGGIVALDARPGPSEVPVVPPMAPNGLRTSTSAETLRSAFGPSVRSRFRKAVHAFVRRNGGGPHPRDETMERLAAQAGLPIEIVLKRLQRAPWARIEEFGSRARVRFTVGSIPPPRVQQKGGEIVRRLAPLVRAYLMSCEGCCAGLSEVRRHLEQEHGALRDHVYRTLKVMPDVIRATETSFTSVRLDPSVSSQPD